MNLDRASTNDLVMLAADLGGQIPARVGAVLLLSGGKYVDLDGVERLLAERINAIPRLCQRLVRTPFGCGRPVWVDDAVFDPADQIERRSCPNHGTDSALLNFAVAISVEPMPSNRPEWRAVVVTGLAGDRVAVVLVVSHVLADGVGGLAVLQRLFDSTSPSSTIRRPRPAPSTLVLAQDALVGRLRALRRLPGTARSIRAAFGSAGGLRSAAATECSLLGPTGRRRRIAIARIELDKLHDVAHANGATINDLLLAAVSTSLTALLATRGEQLATVAITIPVSPRQTATVDDLGNDNAPTVIQIDTSGDLEARVKRISATVREARPAATGPSPAAVFGPIFRVLAGLGFYRRYLRRQHRFHTILADLHGPDRVQMLGGFVVESIIPISLADLGNVSVTFVALSYAGLMTVSVIADPQQMPDLNLLAAALRHELDAPISLMR